MSCVCVCGPWWRGGGAEVGARDARARPSHRAARASTQRTHTHARIHTCPCPTRERSKIPTVLKVVPAIPRNAMGKVGKKALRAELWPELASPAQQQQPKK